MSVGSDIVAALAGLSEASKGNPTTVWDTIAPFLGGAPGNAIYIAGAAGLKQTSILAGYQNAASAAGTIRVALPLVVTGTQITVLIRIFDRTTGPHVIVVQGITGASGVWNAAGFAATLLGKSPATTVRLAHLTASPYTNYILLGPVSVTWNYPDVAVVDAIVGQANVTSDWLTGWVCTRITSETGITIDRTISVLTAGYAFYG